MTAGTWFAVVALVTFFGGMYAVAYRAFFPKTRPDWYDRLMEPSGYGVTIDPRFQIRGVAARPTEPAMPPPPKGGGGISFDRKVSDADVQRFMDAFRDGHRATYLPGGIILRPSSGLPPDLPGMVYPTEPPQRDVAELDGFWSVSGSTFTTIDPVLARAVAAELDRVDPLPTSKETR